MGPNTSRTAVCCCCGALHVIDTFVPADMFLIIANTVMPTQSRHISQGVVIGHSGLESVMQPHMQTTLADISELKDLEDEYYTKELQRAWEREDHPERIKLDHSSARSQAKIYIMKYRAPVVRRRLLPCNLQGVRNYMKHLKTD